MSISSHEFYLQNGAVFQKIFENHAQYGLRPEDRDALLQGREAMIRYTRYGFMIGAMLAPIPLFRGKYAINSLVNLPPLISRTTQKPDIGAIKSRILWIAKSVAATTVGSGIGTWSGFYLGLRKMEDRVDSIPGSRQRVGKAFELAREHLGIPPVPGSPAADHGPPAADLAHSSSVFVPDQDFYQQQTFANQGLEPTTSAPLSPDLSSLPSARSSPPSGQSRWEELRRQKSGGPSAWDTIRQKRAKASPGSPPNQPSDPLDSKEAERKAFEELLEYERKISSGEVPAGALGSSRSS